MIQTAGRWPWKSESAKECVTTHLPNQLALKMNGAERGGRAGPSGEEFAFFTSVLPTSRKDATVSFEAVRARARVEPPWVQILVAVANTPARTWRAELRRRVPCEQ